MKRIRIISFICAIVCVLTIFCGCDKTVPNPEVEGLTKEQIETLRTLIVEPTHWTNTLKHDRNLVIIESYVGTYGGKIVFTYSDGNVKYGELEDKKVEFRYVEDLLYRGYMWLCPYVWVSSVNYPNDRAVVSVRDAYYAGIISYEDLVDIFEKVNVPEDEVDVRYPVVEIPDEKD